MATSLDKTQSSFKSFLGGHPGIKYIPPTSPDFSSISAIHNKSYPSVPLAVVRPQTAEHVATLVSYCTSNGIKFTVRVGGNNIYGLSRAQDALMIDLRDISYSKVDESRTSVSVGGGILLTKLIKDLANQGLVTPTGTIGYLGLVGWSIFGGYGALALKYGLGLDNILEAKIVNAKGEVVVADVDLLKGIRGAGGALGVIVELTVKVYPLKLILGGMIIFGAQDLPSTYESFNASYQTLLEEGIPLELDVQQFVINSPHGKAFAIGVVWASDDHDTGRVWIAKIEALGAVVMNTIAPQTMSEYVEAMGSQVATSSYGSARSINVRRWTKKTTEIISKGLDKMPSSTGTAFSLHELRGPSAAPNADSVFGTREPHFMLEFLSMVDREEDVADSEEWAISLKNEILQKDSENVLPGTYLSVTPPGDVPLSKIYGPDSNYQTVLNLKQKYDPQNVFNLGLPRL